MANVHVLKKTEQEVVLKIYSTESAGQTIQIQPDSTDYILTDRETYANTAEITVKEIFWGAKKDKQIDITRVDDPDANTVHGHYYLLNTGTYNFEGFVDNVYANGAIRIVSDGPFHIIVKLSKSGFPQS